MNETLKISIIIPCYNMEDFIDETLFSVTNQKYSNYEIIIIDGGSTDGTLKIIENYANKIDIFISEKDEGQYNAINKGMSLASGDILAWINADDIYFPWTLEHVGKFFNEHPESQWISGSTSLMDEDGLVFGLNRNVIAKPRKFIQNGWFRDNMYGFLQQEGMFWRKELWELSGGIKEEYKLAADFELWVSFSKYSELISFGLPLASFRIRKSSRSRALKDQYDLEVIKVCQPLKKPFILKRFLGGKSKITNVLLRKSTIRKSKIYYFSPLKECWALNEKYTSLSPHTITSLISLH